MNVIMAYHRATIVRVTLDVFVPKRLAAKPILGDYRKFDLTASLHGGRAQPLDKTDANSSLVDADDAVINPADPTAIFIEANYGNMGGSKEICSAFVIAMLKRYRNVPMICVFSTTPSALAEAKHAIEAHIRDAGLKTNLIANVGSSGDLKLAIDKL